MSQAAELKKTILKAEEYFKNLQKNDRYTWSERLRELKTSLAAETAEATPAAEVPIMVEKPEVALDVTVPEPATPVAPTPRPSRTPTPAKPVGRPRKPVGPKPVVGRPPKPSPLSRTLGRFSKTPRPVKSDVSTTHEKFTEGFTNDLNVNDLAVFMQEADDLLGISLNELEGDEVTTAVVNESLATKTTVDNTPADIEIEGNGDDLSDATEIVEDDETDFDFSAINAITPEQIMEMTAMLSKVLPGQNEIKNSQERDNTPMKIDIKAKMIIKPNPVKGDKAAPTKVEQNRIPIRRSITRGKAVTPKTQPSVGEFCN